MGCKCTESPTNYQRSLSNFRWLHIPLKKKPNTDIAPMAAQIGSTLVKSAQMGAYAGSMALAACSVGVGVISVMRTSKEQVTSALEVVTSVAHAVGKEGLGVVAASGKEGLGAAAEVVAAAGKEGLGSLNEGLGAAAEVVAAAGKEGLGSLGTKEAAAVVVSSMILYRGLMRWMDQQAKAQQQAQQALNEAQLALLRSQEQALRLAEQAQAGQSSVIKLLEGKLEALQPLARPPSHGDPAQ